MKTFLRWLGFSYISFALAALALSYWGYSAANLKVRQPISGTQSPVLSKPTGQVVTLSSVQKKVRLQDPRKSPLHISHKMNSAKQWAERMDGQVPTLFSLATQGFWQRWMQASSRRQLEQQYSQDALSHIRAMTEVMKLRRQVGGFKKLEEFDFRNTVRKSDYLLSLEMTRHSLKKLSQDHKLGPELRDSIVMYNQERLLFDQSFLEI